MELHLPLLSFMLLLVTLIIVKHPSSKSKLPPRPWSLPFIGHLHHMLRFLPHVVLRKLSRAHGPLMLLRLGEVTHIVVSSPDTAKHILKTHDLTFASRPKLLAPTIVAYDNRDIFSPYGAYWRQLRKICVHELLSVQRVMSIRPIMEDMCSRLVRDISSSRHVNLTEEFLRFANGTIARAAFGEEFKYGERFTLEMKKLIELASGFYFGDLYPSLGFVGTVTGMRARLERNLRRMDEILNVIIEEHKMKMKREDKDKEEEDIVDVLLRLKEHGDLECPLTISDVKAVILDMFSAGTETTSMSLVWAMSELMRHPKAMSAAQTEVRKRAKGKDTIEEGDIDDLRYVKLVIKESLRLHPPVPLLVPRVCSEDCEVGGFDIPKGSRILINVWAIARDPVFWKDPDSFYPERFDDNSIDFRRASFEYLPFGGGRRICPGIAFGIASMELALARILFHFDWEELPGGVKPQDLDMTESFGATLGRKSDLWLNAKPHIASHCSSQEQRITLGYVM